MLISVRLNKELATILNVKATEIIAKQAAKQQIFFVYVSTDYIFDGIQGMRKENDATNPLGFYGKSKLEGETVLNKLCIHIGVLQELVLLLGLHH